MVRPSFSIKIDDKDLESQFLKKMGSISVVDEIDSISDSVHINFIDNEKNLAIPKSGVKLQLSIGIDEKNVNIGTYVIDEVVLSPGDMSVSGKGFDTHANIKKIRSRNYPDDDLYNCIKYLAHENGLNGIISEKFRGIKINIAHHAESDMHFITRLGKKHDAIFKIQDKNLMFSEKIRNKNSRNENIDTLNLSENEAISWNLQLSGRSIYRNVEAQVFNLDTGEKSKVSLGEGAPVLRLPGHYRTSEEALSDCKGFLRGEGYENKNISLELPGNPEVKAGRQINLKNFRNGIDGVWLIKKVSHEINTHYTTRMDLIKYNNEVY